MNDQPFGSWRLEGRDGMEVARVRSSLWSNLGEIAHRWALDRYGIVLRSFWDIADRLRVGGLERVLSVYGQEADVWAVHPIWAVMLAEDKGVCAPHHRASVRLERGDGADSEPQPRRRAS